MYQLIIALCTLTFNLSALCSESGQNVTLTCRAPNSNSINIVEWSRAGLGSQYVFVYWDGHFVPEEQHQYFKNRVDLQDRQMKDGDVSVTLKNVTTDDTGTYKCRVQREDDSVELICIIYLRVVEEAYCFLFVCLFPVVAFFLYDARVSDSSLVLFSLVNFFRSGKFMVHHQNPVNYEFDMFHSSYGSCIIGPK
uniref:Ig-like domain-containing protein n=1 Tax=Amphilophus citrinellus TaxID=61819 RepID=A0A3Q0RPN4_AMPCI